MSQDDEVLRASPAEGLSAELVRMVLSAAPDVESLRAAVVSCPLFYRAFLEAEASVTEQVLLNQIDASVLPDARLAFESREGIVDFTTAQSLRERSTLPQTWSLRDALRLGRLHPHVEKFANVFAWESLTKSPLNQSKLISTRPEICRMQRALYRFETYFNLFRDPPDVPSSTLEEQRRLFFANYAPWENEQLGCIHDFLVRVISPGFNESTTASGVPFVSAFIHYILSFGLEKLRLLAGAETEQKRYRLLGSNYWAQPAYSCLHEALHYSNGEFDDIIYLYNMKPEDDSIYLTPPFFADPDSGPADAWRWAHLEERCGKWVYQDNRHDLRHWGYVMWDRSRLDAVGVLQEPWEDAQEEQAFLKEEALRKRALSIRASMIDPW